MDNLINLIDTNTVSQSQIKAVKELLEFDKKTSTLLGIESLLSWDQEVHMPFKGECNREAQISMTTLLVHEYSVHPKVAELLYTLGVTEENKLGNKELPKKVRLWLRAKYRQWYHASCMPPALLQEIASTRVQSHSVWVEARKKNDFSLFAPYLEKTVALQRDMADCLGYQDSRYSALLNLFEEGATTNIITPLFQKLQTQLVPFYQKMTAQHQHGALSTITATKQEQEAFFAYLKPYVGYCDSCLLLDESAHPFCTKIGDGDVRLTVRYIEDNPLSSIFSMLHELGHATYDSNIDDIFKHTVCYDGCSFGVHESQSRFFECIIGKQQAFWEYHYPVLQKSFKSLATESLDNFMHRINYVQPSVIRIESDEVSYNLHIIIRFEIEKALIEGSIEVADVPELWREKYKNLLGIAPKDDAEGVLQDVHWSAGLFGYFPSYTLGNLYAAKLYEKLAQEIPEYKDTMRRGDINNILQWLQNTIHIHGASKQPQELLDIEIEPFMNYLQHRYNTQ